MPVKWDSVKDMFILNVLLLDPSVNIGSAIIENIISSWPAEFGDAPTKKAVGEHFSKIRKTNKKYADGISTPGATPAKKARASPVKKNNGTKTPTSSRKRKTPAYASDSDNDGAAEKGFDGIKVKGEVESDDPDEESPSKRARSERAKTEVKYEVADDDDGALLSGSDFQNDEA